MSLTSEQLLILAPGITWMIFTAIQTVIFVSWIVTHSSTGWEALKLKFNALFLLGSVMMIMLMISSSIKATPGMDPHNVWRTIVLFFNSAVQLTYMFYLYIRTATVATSSKYTTWLLKGLTAFAVLSSVVAFLIVAGGRIASEIDFLPKSLLTGISVLSLAAVGALDITCITIFSRHVYKSRKTLHKSKSETDIVAAWCAACCSLVVVLGVFVGACGDMNKQYPATYLGIVDGLNFFLLNFLFLMKIAIFRFQKEKTLAKQKPKSALMNSSKDAATSKPDVAAGLDQESDEFILKSSDVLTKTKVSKSFGKVQSRFTDESRVKTLTSHNV